MVPDCRVHGIITKGGEKPNIIPQIGQLEYFVRGVTDEQRDEVKKKVLACAEAAAVATGNVTKLFIKYLPNTNIYSRTIKPNFSMHMPT